MSGKLARMSRHSPHIAWRTAGRVSDADGDRRRCRPRDRLGVQQRGRRLGHARRVRRHRRRRGAGLPRVPRTAHARRRRAHAGRDRLRHRPHDLRLHRASSARWSPATSTPAFSSAATRRSAGSARSTGCARSMSPTAARSTSPTTPPTSRFSYITLQHCLLDDALALATEAVPRRTARRPDRTQLPCSRRLRRGRGPGRSGRARLVPHPLLGDRLARAAASPAWPGRSRGCTPIR